MGTAGLKILVSFACLVKDHSPSALAEKKMPFDLLFCGCSCSTNMIVCAAEIFVRGDLKFETSYFVNQIQQGGGRGNEPPLDLFPKRAL